MGYMSELSDYTRISVTQNNLQELKEIWDQWENKTKQLFYGNYGDLPYLLDVQVDEHLFRALAKFWNPAYSCFTFGEVDLVPTVEEYTALLRCPKFQVDRIYSRDASVPTFWKKLMTITGMSEQWITARIKEKGECKCISWDSLKGLILTHPDETKKLLLAWFYSHFRLIDRVICRVFFEDYSPLKDIVASTRRVDVPEENWIVLLQNLQSKDIEWRAPWMIPGEILYRYGSFDWVPLLGIWGAIVYAPLLMLRQFGLRQSVLATHGLAQSEFMCRGADYKKRRGRRINDNIPKPSVEGARPIEEYLRVMPLELEIIKKEFERRNLELEKRIAKLEEEKMYLSLDVDKEVQEEKARAEYWEKRFQEILSQDLALEEENKGSKTKLEAQEDYLKGELHQSRGQVRERDHVMGEAIAQIREVAEYVQDLVVRADVLSLMCGSLSDIGRELALLLDRVKTLGIRAKAYL
ncbi:hypothetical protein CXB51_004508 [Gossypium anomalum]|uniref:DUF7745 domain-containing protein n=1 Tax=Gossypium anomalum TaxID=47600 RepID=A0A8J5Z4T9_9ROSI|nr:hypothetical protein CXB51_004508 [Gossypium anomalum]